MGKPVNTAFTCEKSFESLNWQTDVYRCENLFVVIRGQLIFSELENVEERKFWKTLERTADVIGLNC